MPAFRRAGLRYAGLPLAALLLLAATCEPAPRARPPAEVYRRIARPEIWRLLPSGQAARLGLEPGDLLLSYNQEPLATNADVIAAQERAAGSGADIPVTVLRAGRELGFLVAPGPLGVLPAATRYPSSLAIALEAVAGSFGLVADYDWLAALTGESFALAAADDACRAWWPAGASGDYLDDLALMAGLELEQLHPLEADGDALPRVRDALDRGRAVLVLGGWPGHRVGFWGVVTRFDPDQGEAGLLSGHTLDSAEELPLITMPVEAYAVAPGLGWDDADELLALALTQALELGQARTDVGWQTGLQAWDRLILSLDTVPFCPACGLAESPVCFDRLLWAIVAHKQSAIRYLDRMRGVAPDLTPLFDEIIGDLTAQVAKLEGIAWSGMQVGDLEQQRNIARAIAEIQVIENDLLGLYEELLAGL